MSRAEINMLLIDIDLTYESVRSYREDPAGFVNVWETKGRNRIAGRRVGGVLTPEERRAFMSFDYAALYRLGAHPFILWQMVRSVAVTQTTTVDEVIADYRRKIEPLGHPDFGT